MNSESTNEVNNELNLWPSDLTDFQVKSPVDILKEQAILLGRNTGDLVTGEVSLLNERSGYDFLYKFSIESDIIGYKYHLFTIAHDVELYPVTFFDLSDEINNELHDLLQYIDEAGRQPNHIRANSDKDFVNVLRRIFQSKKAIAVIRGILAQARTKKKYDPFVALKDIPF